MHAPRCLILAALALACATNTRADFDAPSNIRVTMQLIEVPLPTLTELTTNPEMAGHQLHAKAFEWTRSGKAKLLDTCYLACCSGRRATVESVLEWIYPTEHGFSLLPNKITPGSQPPPPPPVHFLPRPPTPTAFGTRNTGATLEVEPTLSADDKHIDLRFAPEIVTPRGLTTWCEFRDKWGDASVRMPLFETWKANTGITLTDGRFELVSVVTPEPADPVPGQLRKILVFVRADVIRLHLPQ